MHPHGKTTTSGIKSRTFHENQFFSRKHEFIHFLKEMPLGVLLTNKEQRVEYCNPAFSAILGFENDEIYSCDMKDLFCSLPHDQDSIDQNTEHVDESSTMDFVCNWNTKMGIEKKIRCKKVDLTLGERSFTGTAWYIEDLTFSVDINETFCQMPDENESQILFKRKLEIERAISYVSSTLVAPEDLDDALVKSLERTGEICGASRVYLFRLHDNNQNMSNTHEWCAVGVEPQKENLQDLPVGMFPWWMDKINREEIIYIKDVSSMPGEAAAEKEILEMQDITSLLVLPVHISGKIAGFIGLDNVTAAIKWSMEDAVILGVVANIIGSAIGQKEIQDALNERNMKLEKAYNELKKIEVMKDEFISNLSHELRTPLNSVLGYSELLMEDESAPPDSKQKRVASSVYYSSKRLSSLIDSLLYMGNVIAGKIEYQFDPIQMENVIDKSVSRYTYDAQKKNITIKRETIGNLPIIYGDVYFLPQLFYKLIDNAIKFTPNGGSITIRCSEKDSGVHVEVIDSGIGVPEEKIKEIFKSFYQVDGSTTRKYGGTGIGLYVSKKIVDAHGGNIWIQNNETQGTVVHVVLPVNAQTNIL